MALQDIALVLRPKVDDSQSKPKLEQQSKLLRQQEVEIAKYGRAAKRVQDDMARGWARVGTAAKLAGTGATSALSGLGRGLDMVNRGTSALHRNFLNLRTAFTTGLLGYATFGGISKILRAGAEDLAMANRAKRMFGTRAPMLQAIAGRQAKLAAVDDSEMLGTAVRIFSDVDALQLKRSKGEGATAFQARLDAVKKQRLERGVGMVTRLKTLAPEYDTETIARIVSMAASGPGTMRMFGNMFKLNRKVGTELERADSKRKLFEMATPEERVAFGLQKGKSAGQYTVMQMLLKRSGMTEEAAAATRKKFPFQAKAIGASLETAMGEVGSIAMEKLNKKLAEGGSLAEKLDKWLESPKGKDAMEKFADVMSRIVMAMGNLAQKIPGLIGFLDRHKTAIGLLAGTVVTAKAYGAVKEPLGAAWTGVKGLGRLFGNSPIGKIVNAAEGVTAMPVRVVNWPGSAIPGGGGPGVPVAPSVPGRAGFGSRLATFGGTVAGASLAGGANAAVGLALLGAAHTVREGINLTSAADKYSAELASGRKRGVSHWYNFGGQSLEDVPEAERGKAAQEYAARRAKQDPAYAELMRVAGGDTSAAFRASVDPEFAKALRGGALGAGGASVNVNGTTINVPSSLPKGAELTSWLDSEVWPALRGSMAHDIEAATAGGSASVSPSPMASY